MIIDKIIPVGIEKLYELISKKQISPSDNKKMFGKNLTSLYNMSGVICTATAVTPIEYYFLKLFSSSITEYKSDGISSDFFKANDIFKVPNKDNKSIYTVISDALSTDKLLKAEYGGMIEHYLPNSVRNGECSFELKGIDLMRIFTLEPAMFFKTQGIDIGSPTELYKPEVMKKFMSDLKGIITKEFYFFMLENYNYSDIATDYILYNSYYSKIPYSTENNMIISTLRNPYISLDLTDSSNTALVVEKINKFKQLGIDNEYIRKYTSFDIICGTTLDLFLFLNNLLPKECFVGHEMYTILNKYYDEISINYKYTTEGMYSIAAERFIQFTKDLKQIYLSSDNIFNENTYARIFMANNNAPIRFVLSLSLDQINTFLYPYSRLKMNTYTDKIFSKFVTNIVNTCLKYYQLLIK